MSNFFELPEPLPSEETFEPLVDSSAVLIERIISCGQTTPPGQWYDQERDEWVLLVQGQAAIAYDDGTEIRLGAGDSLLIAAHQRHRVTFTSADPPCLWLAVHGPLTHRENVPTK